MLILVRKVQQGIWIEGDIFVKVLSVERDRVKLGISAPGDVKVMRQELMEAAAGVPPTNGFVSKLLLFSSGIEVAAAEPASYLLLVLIAAGGVLTLIYVMRAFQLIWWQVAGEDAPGSPPPAEGQPKKRPDRLLAPALLVTVALALGIWAEPLVRVAWEASLWLSSPAAYIQAVLGG